MEKSDFILTMKFNKQYSTYCRPRKPGKAPDAVVSQHCGTETAPHFSSNRYCIAAITTILRWFPAFLLIPSSFALFDRTLHHVEVHNFYSTVLEKCFMTLGAVNGIWAQSGNNTAISNQL